MVLLGHECLVLLLIEVLLVLLHADSDSVAFVIFGVQSKVLWYIDTFGDAEVESVTLLQLLDQITDLILEAVVDKDLPFRRVFVWVDEIS